MQETGRHQGRRRPGQPRPDRARAKGKPTAAEARAAERSQLAGSIHRPGADFAAGAAPSPGEDGVSRHHNARNRKAIEFTSRDRWTDPKQIAARAVSGRLLALAVVLIAVTVMLAPSVKIFLDQQGEISALEDEIAQQQAAQEKLESQLSRWEDPAYVRQQARDRLFLVMPGEKQYLVFGADPGAGDVPEAASDSADGIAAQDLPWVDTLWESVKRSATD